MNCVQLFGAIQIMIGFLIIRYYSEQKEYFILVKFVSKSQDLPCRNQD